MDQKHSCSTAGLTLANQTTVKTHMVRQPHPNAKYGKLTVDDNASGANPFLNLASRRKAGSREHLLETFSFVAPLAAPSAADIAALTTQSAAIICGQISGRVS